VDEDDTQSERSGFRYGSTSNTARGPREPREIENLSATESSPLLSNEAAGKLTRSTIFLNHLSYLPSTLLPGLVALAIALIPPIKKTLVGDSTGWSWNIIGGIIGWIGLSFVIVDTIGMGAVIKRSELNKR
jgi:hypothetical protein